MSEPLHYSEYDTRLAAYAVIVERRDGVDQILLALWNEESQPRWTLPGGGVELEETVEVGVVREVREETGYDVALGELIGVDSYVIPVERRTNGSGRPLKAVRVVFTARIVGGELTHELDGTTDEARWHPLSEVASLPQVSLVGIGLRMLRP